MTPFFGGLTPLILHTQGLPQCSLHPSGGDKHLCLWTPGGINMRGLFWCTSDSDQRSEHLRGPSRGPGASHSVSTLRGSCEMTDCLCPQAQIPGLSLPGSLSEDCFPLEVARLQLNERRGHSGMFQLIGAEVGGGVGWGGVDFRVRPGVPYADSVRTKQHPRFRLPA